MVDRRVAEHCKKIRRVFCLVEAGDWWLPERGLLAANYRLHHLPAVVPVVPGDCHDS
jgi:hypothetical protein